MQKLRAVLLVAFATLLAVAVPASAAGKPQPRIINGDESTQGQYPWTVALIATTGPRAGKPFCGGTVIDEAVILTAAHCTIGSAPGDIEVLAGTVNLGSTATDQRRTVSRISLHREAQGDDDDIVPRRDVSLLTLTTPLDLVDDEVEIMSLGTALDADNALSFEASGWGVTEDSNGDTVPVMRNATLARTSDTNCGSIYESIFGHLVFSPVDQLCAITDPDPSHDTEGDIIDTCNGDSGGPLVASAGGNDPTDAADWELIGVTSWGADCAVAIVDQTGPPFDPDIAVPGVYARAAGAQLRQYVIDAQDGTDDALEQPHHISGDPEIDFSESLGIYCVGNELTWAGDPDEVEQLIRRDTGGGLETVSTTGQYFPDESDDEEIFVCEVRARRFGAGGYGRAVSSGGIGLDFADPEPQIIEVPVPTPVPGPPVIVPGPTVTQQLPAPPDLRDFDDDDPRVSSVRRSCTRRRICTFTIQATDNVGGTGVKSVVASINTVRTRSCRRNGRRTTCASWRATALRARRVPGRTGQFRVTTRRLSRGAHVLHASAVDRAGNAQASPRRVSFRLR